MTCNNGWIGTSDELLTVLALFHAKKDDDGKFLIRGEAPISFLGMGEEMVVSERSECQMPNGNWVPVVSLLHQTSYGMKVGVI